jgi:hypothetical protein
MASRRGDRRIGRVGLRGHLAEEAEHPGFVAALLLALREVEGTPGDGERVVRAAGQEVRFPKVGQEERMVGDARRRGISHRLL